MPKNVTAQAMFNAICDAIDSAGLPTVTSVTLDGCTVNWGIRNGLVALLRRRYPDIKAYHCILHEFALSVKLIPTLKKTLATVKRIIVLIKVNNKGKKLFIKYETLQNLCITLSPIRDVYFEDFYLSCRNINDNVFMNALLSFLK